MTFLLILMFVIGPIAEIYVLLKAGTAFGLGPVLLACVATAMIGGFLLRRQGLAAVRAAQADMAANRPPFGPLSDGLMLVAAAPFLMTPGFITDVAGFLLLVPAVRRALAKRAAAYIQARADARSGVITIKRG